VGDGDAGRAVVRPGQEVVAVALRQRWLRIRGGGGPSVEIDQMFMPLIDDGGDGTVVDVVESAANEGKAFGDEVDDGGREIELAVEPGFNRVLIGRGDVEQVIAH